MTPSSKFKLAFALVLVGCDISTRVWAVEQAPVAQRFMPQAPQAEPAQRFIPIVPELSHPVIVPTNNILPRAQQAPLPNYVAQPAWIEPIVPILPNTPVLPAPVRAPDPDIFLPQAPLAPEAQRFMP